MTTIYLAKHIPNVERWEPRNVGMIVADASVVVARFIGEIPGADGIDRRRVGHWISSSEVYSEWVRFWRRSIAQGQAGIEELLVARQESYVVFKAAEVIMGNESPQILLDRYYGQLVDDAAGEGDDSLRAATDRLIERTGLSRRPEFRRDFSIRSTNLPAPEPFVFPYAFVNGSTTVAQRVGAQPPYIHDATWKFSHLDESVRKIAIVNSDRLDMEMPAIRNLQGVASHVVDVAKPEAEQLLQVVFVGN